MGIVWALMIAAALVILYISLVSVPAPPARLL